MQVGQMRTDEDSCAGSKAKRPRIYALLYNKEKNK